ncbi:uncharacterized protein TNCT_233751 [Trichonephila clavata]|uniref:Uncharacterized protein n=1 Tax=Trichonephila clavata TaxID=2740835 RepID=A0A8X6FK33_TRICU|nr:uncharacterized protein TNCT_233751 [Trichonephila clavata]
MSLYATRSKEAKIMVPMSAGDLVWFDPGIGYLLPGEVADFSKPAQVITVQALISGKPQNFTLHNLESVRKRQDLGPNGFEDMIELIDLNEASLLWNLKIRYDKEMIYVIVTSAKNQFVRNRKSYVKLIHQMSFIVLIVVASNNAVSVSK